MRTAISMTWEVCNISDLRRLPRKCWYHCEAQKHPVKSVHISLGFWVSRLPFTRIYSWECRQVYAIAIQGHSHNIGSKVIGTGNCINDLRTEQARIGQSVGPLGRSVPCSWTPLQEEGQGWGGAHTNAHSRAAPGRGTHPLRAGSGAFPAPRGCHPVGPSGSKSLGLSRTKASPLFDASIGILGLPPYPHCSTHRVFV